MATRNIVPRANGEGSIGTTAKHWGAGHFDELNLAGEDVAGTLSNMDLALAESTGHGIISGCEPTISGLTVTVAAGIVHLADGTRKELSATNITLDAADSTNPRIDLVYIDSTGAVAKVTGTAAASPSAPNVPTGGISICNVSVAAAAENGIVTENIKYKNENKIHVSSFFRNILPAVNPSFKTVMGLQGLLGGYEQYPFVHTVRISLIWDYIEPFGDGRYYFDSTTGYTPAKYIENAIKANKTVIVYFEVGAGTNAFNAAYPTANNKFRNDDGRALAGYKKFVAAAARRFAGYGIIWEMFNEPVGDGTADVMGMVKAFSESISKNDKSGFKVAPSYDSLNLSSLRQANNSMANLIDQGLLNYIDAISFHNYRSDIPESDGEDSGINGLKRLLTTKGYGDYPLYCTEWGYSLYNQFLGTSSLTEKQQADYLARSYLYDVANGVSIHVWHVLRNGAQENYTDHKSTIYQENNFGLLRNNFEKKPAYYAYRELSNIMQDAKFVRRIFCPIAYVRLYLFKQSTGKYILAFYNTTANDTFNVTIDIPRRVFSSTLYIPNVTTGNTTVTTVSSQTITLPVSPTPSYLVYNSETSDVIVEYIINNIADATGNIKFRINENLVNIAGQLAYSEDVSYNKVIFRMPTSLMPQASFATMIVSTAGGAQQSIYDKPGTLAIRDSGDVVFIGSEDFKILRIHNTYMRN